MHRPIPAQDPSKGPEATSVATLNIGCSYNRGSMGRSVMKRVRMSPERVERLAKLAERTGKTESELIREGLDLVENRERQKIAVEELIGLVQGEPPQKIRFRLSK
jgi:predicted DNA-binding protein